MVQIGKGNRGPESRDNNGIAHFRVADVVWGRNPTNAQETREWREMGVARLPHLRKCVVLLGG